MSTIGLAVQPEVLRGLASRPGSAAAACWPGSCTASQSLVVADRQAPHLSPQRWPTATPSNSRPWPPASPLRPATTGRRADHRPGGGELLLGFERDLEPRLAAGSGDLAHLAGWAAKLAGATCRLAGLLHLAAHLRDGWARPIRPTPSPAPAWPATWSSTPERCST